MNAVIDDPFGAVASVVRCNGKERKNDTQIVEKWKKILRNAWFCEKLLPN